MRLPLAPAKAIILTLFVGSTWTIGYLVAPTLFSALTDRSLAGSIAGSLFRTEAWVSLGCALLLVVLVRWPGSQTSEDHRRNRTATVLIASIAACTLIGYFGLQPFMAALRSTAAANGGLMPPDARMQFGLLHGVSSLIYLVKSMLGMLLVAKLR